MTAIQRFQVSDDVSGIFRALEADGAVIVEGLLDPDVVALVNDEVRGAVEAADSDVPKPAPELQLTNS